MPVIIKFVVEPFVSKHELDCPEGLNGYILEYMDQIAKNIKQAEKKRLPGILAHGQSLFRENPLPSHDMDHHLRVWHFAKKLIYLFGHDKEITSKDFIDGLLVASLFHDMGMVHNTGADHGKESRELCSGYFQICPCAPPAGFLNVLQAIEYHDVKEYGNKPGIGEKPLLLMLNLADDLDAYGIIGFFRYLEIYLLRGISREKMPGLMEKNLDHRFGLFQKNLHFAHDFLAKQEQRYVATKKAFALLKKGRLGKLTALFGQTCVKEKRSYTEFIQKNYPGTYTGMEKEILDKLHEEITTTLLTSST